jgi:hypothetical protein
MLCILQFTSSFFIFMKMTYYCKKFIGFHSVSINYLGKNSLIDVSRRPDFTDILKYRFVGL